jgi:nitroreductase
LMPVNELEQAESGSKESAAPKSNRGGKRAGAGRKPNLTKILLKGVSRETILAACENVDLGAVIIGLLRSKREQSRIEALHFIFDRVMGKPKQDVNVSGGMLHANTRDPLLAALPKEALEALARSYDDVIAKYALPVLDVSQDSPQNQTESKPAIEVESQATTT